ncbi:MAG: DUF134 domain-containing protein [Candidatus Saccharicenans sp.]|uniref:DUF134 domain-containing protein n=1 Tax=Candidatus Saccharicenans sp. TaxID=2819258 RepID=UPI00404A3DBC
MPRPFCQRRIGWRPGISRFLPEGQEAQYAEVITLRLDELEAIRLADLDGLYQEQAAEKMGVSRPTFARILESGRKKVAEALINGKGLVIEGGPVEIEPGQFEPGHFSRSSGRRGQPGPQGPPGRRGRGGCQRGRRFQF